MDTTTDAIAKLIAEARERAHGLQFEVDYQTMRALADTLEAVTRERDDAVFMCKGAEFNEGCVIAAHNEIDAELVAARAQLEVVTRERDSALVREDLSVKVFQREQDNVIALQSQIKAVTKERDALRSLVSRIWQAKAEVRAMNYEYQAEELEAVTKERDELRRQVAAYRDTHGCEKDDICNLCKEVDDNAK